MTKTFVAAAVLRLVEEGKVKLDAPITEYVSPESLAVLRTDKYDLDHITVRQLLQHTSGLYDYATDDAYDQANVSDPAHRWTRLEQLQFAVDHGHPLAPPGKRFSYADTNYILLGEIIERATGTSLPAAVRELLHLDRLGLDHTYWEILEPTPPGTPAAPTSTSTDTTTSCSTRRPTSTGVADSCRPSTISRGSTVGSSTARCSTRPRR